jgi:hypothetical protein
LRKTKILELRCGCHRRGCGSTIAAKGILSQAALANLRGRVKN